MSAALVELDGIGREYRRASGAVRALAEVSLTIRAGELVSISGPSGSGKSTLLHILGLLDTPTTGSYRLAGEDVGTLDDAGRAGCRNRSVGFVFQAFHLVPHLSVAANVELPLVYRGMTRARRAQRVAAALARVGLDRRADHRPDELSGGEQQRAAVARALVPEPALLLADEPTGNLDDGSAAAVLGLFEEAQRGGTAVVVVTHNARVAARATRGYHLRDGRLV